jgi:hypothetical protein
VKMSNAIVALLYKLPSGPSRRALFVYYFHRFPNLKHPKTFNEKLNWRILKDRRPILAWTCDKLAMKEYVQKSQPAKEFGVCIPRTLWYGANIQDLSSVELPEHWVFKPNHRSGQVYFGQGQPDINALDRISQRWIYPFEHNDLHEWAYSKARPLLVVEELLGKPGSVPADYKFYVFAGEVAAIQVDVDRHNDHHRRFYSSDWSPIDPISKDLPLAPLEPPPANLDRMLAIASELGRPFDFMRVDLYNVNNDIFFGELTPYSGSGLDVMEPPVFDLELGMKWKLPEIHRLSKGRQQATPKSWKCQAGRAMTPHNPMLIHEGKRYASRINVVPPPQRNMMRRDSHA